MRLKILLSTFGLGAALIALAATALFKSDQVAQSAVAERSVALVQNSTSPILGSATPFGSAVGRPVRLKIPKINVDADITEVGLTSKGAMDIPKGAFDVAWFKLGPRPGDNGSAVIAGHFGPWKNGSKSVFDDLSKLRKGDKIYVEDDGGVTVTFVVRGSKTYGKNQNASDVFGSIDSKAHLNLITCEGVWDKAKATFSNRLVVFTDKE